MSKLASAALAVTLLATGLSVSAPAPSFAQAGPVSVSGIAPRREELERRPVQPVPPSVGQRVSAEGAIERSPCPLAAPEFANLTLVLSDVEFVGLKGLSAAEIRPSWAADLGQTIPIAKVCEIRDAAATLLRQRGYLAAVQIPPQKIENGKVRFDVLMARVVGFQVRGNAGKAEKLIEGYLSAIKDQEIFNIQEAERYLLLARDIPGYDVRMTLRPAGTQPGEVIGEVQVVHTPVEAQINVQNYGSRETGRFGGLAQVQVNGLLGTGDRTTLGFYSTADFKEQQVAQFGHEFRVGREGLTIQANGSYAWTKPALGAGIDLTSRTWLATLQARYPLARRQSRNAFVSGGLEFIDQKVRFAGIPLTTDKLRVAFLRLDYDEFDANSLGSIGGYSAAEPRWRFGGSLELRQGLGILGASDDCGPTLARCALPGVTPISRLEADTTAFVARLQGYAEYRPDPILALSVAPRLQYAFNPLLSYEEFSAGSFTVGRGYDPGAIAGDRGIGIAGEVKLGSLVPRSAKHVAVQGYGFVDAAWVWNKDVFRTVPNPDRLISAGGGVRTAWGERMLLDAGVAVPLRKTGIQASRSEVRFLINLTVRLLPWQR